MTMLPVILQYELTDRTYTVCYLSHGDRRPYQDKARYLPGSDSSAIVCGKLWEPWEIACDGDPDGAHVIASLSLRMNHIYISDLNNNNQSMVLLSNSSKHIFRVWRSRNLLACGCAGLDFVGSRGDSGKRGKSRDPPCAGLACIRLLVGRCQMKPSRL